MTATAYAPTVEVEEEPRPAYRPFAVRLARRRVLSPTFVRLTFTGDDLARCGDTCLDQRVKLVFATPAQISQACTVEDWYGWWLGLDDAERPAMRTYTVRRVRRHDSEVDIDFAVHGTDGPASRFAQQAPVGAELVLVAPDHGAPGADVAGVAWRPGPARTLFLAGDETAVPAICGIVEKLPDHATGDVLVEVPTIADALEVSAPPGVRVTWLARGGRPAGDALVEAAARWADARGATGAAPLAGEVPTEVEDLLWDEAESGRDCYAWVAGEAGVVARLRRLLVRERGLDKASCSFMGYWKVGRAS